MSNTGAGQNARARRVFCTQDQMQDLVRIWLVRPMTSTDFEKLLAPLGSSHSARRPEELALLRGAGQYTDDMRRGTRARLVLLRATTIIPGHTREAAP